jgi:hypothetical protein
MTRLFRGLQHFVAAQRRGDHAKFHVHAPKAHQPLNEAKLAQDVERKPVAEAECARDRKSPALIAPPALGKHERAPRPDSIAARAPKRARSAG